MKLFKKPAGWWYCQLRGGIPFSLKTKSEEVAKARVKRGRFEELEVARQSQALAKAAIASVQVMNTTSIALLVHEWNEWATTMDLAEASRWCYKHHILSWARDRGLLDKPVSEATEKDIHDWVNDDSPRKLATRIVRKAALNHFFRYCHGKGYIHNNPALLSKVRVKRLSFKQKETTKRVPFTELEYKMLLNRIRSKRLKFWEAAVQLAWECGLRLSDCCLITGEQFTADGKLIVWIEKTNKRIELPAPDVKIPPKGFPEYARRYHDVPLRWEISREFTAILKDLCMADEHSFHDLRHSFATRHKALGATVDEIREKLGHSTNAMTERYIHEDTDTTDRGLPRWNGRNLDDDFDEGGSDELLPEDLSDLRGGEC